MQQIIYNKINNVPKVLIMKNLILLNVDENIIQSDTF